MTCVGPKKCAIDLLLTLKNTEDVNFQPPKNMSDPSSIMYTMSSPLPQETDQLGICQFSAIFRENDYQIPV